MKILDFFMYIVGDHNENYEYIVDICCRYLDFYCTFVDFYCAFVDFYCRYYDCVICKKIFLINIKVFFIYIQRRVKVKSECKNDICEEVTEYQEKE